MRSILIFFIIVTLASCHEQFHEIERSNNFLIEKEFLFPDKVEQILSQRINELSNSVKGISIIFNNTFDSTRFIISNVYSKNQLGKYPPNFYYKKNGIYVFVYSGLEPFYKGSDSIVIPKVILDSMIDFGVNAHPPIIEPLNVEYKFFNLDPSDTLIVHECLEYNKYLPLEVLSQ